MKSIADLLDEHPFFEGLGQPTLDLISGCGTNTHYAAGDTILEEGGRADRFFVVRRGRVAIEVDAARGEPIVVATVGPGEILGVSWMLPPYRWTFDARATEDTSAVAIDAECLRGKCDEDPALGYALFIRFAGLVRDRLHAARLQLLDLYGTDVRR